MAWTGYEYATLAVTALTPITVAGLGFFVARIGRRLERVQWANQTVVTRRLEIFGQVAPANRVLFSDALFAAYQDFMAALFAMYATTDAAAHLRAPVASKWGDRRNMTWWHDSMASLFSADQAGDIAQIQAAYDKLGEHFRDDLYVTHQRMLLNAQS